MVVALGPGKFYGSSLPRPRIYTDMKFSDERVDPPVSVNDALMSWAADAHWSMGGLSFERHRLQGKIEGNVKKLRAEREKHFKTAEKLKSSSADKDCDVDQTKTPSPPPAPLAVKRRRRYVGLVDEESDEEREEFGGEFRRTARKLKDDFDLVADKKLKTPLKSADAAAAMAAEVVEEEVRPKTRKSRRNDEETVEEEEDVKTKIVKKKNKADKTRIASAKKTRISPRSSKKD